MKPTKRFRRLRRALKIVGVLFAVGAVALFVAAYVSTDHFRAFGGSPGPASLERIRASPHYKGDHFENLETTVLEPPGTRSDTFRQLLFGKEMRVPICPLPIVGDAAVRLGRPAETGLRITWLGHSTTLIEIDGSTILTDPVWSERASPSRWVGPVRFHPPPIALADLPHLDAVIVSHEHYDHLDMETIRALSEKGVVFHVPLGIGAHLEKWGVPTDRIFEHDWWEASDLPSGLRLVSTPSRHFNGRGEFWRSGALWTSWSLVGPHHRVFFSGDTGLTESFREIASREGPFDVALLEIGQYHPNWGSIHLGPQGALEAQSMLGNTILFPIHWATFNLAFHDWSEPAETLTRLASERGAAIVTPRLGEPIEPLLHPDTPPWWRNQPPMTATCP